MNQALNSYKDNLQGKRIAVIGAGISNRPLLRWLYPINPQITVFDMMDPSDDRLISIQKDFQEQGLSLEWICGQGYLDQLSGFDLIFRTPRMRIDLPELVREREKGARVTSEIALFSELCPAPITAVTGSDGKTTTTTLISLILEAGGHRVHTGGNIGTPLIDRIDSIRPEDRVVLELSSFQLLDMTQRIHCAVITNIIPNHLDFHLDFEEYADAKQNIHRWQKAGDILVLNAGDQVTQALIEGAQGELRFFNKRDREGRASAWRQEGKLWIQLKEEEEARIIMEEGEVLLPGSFNLENILAASLATAGEVSLDAVRQVGRSFKGVAHRMELVAEAGAVRWYNSSVDSSPSRTMKTLSAFEEGRQDLVLIAGGQDKNSDYIGLGQAIARTTRRLILCGQNADLILQALEREAGPAMDEMRIERTADYEEAISLAWEMAGPGDAVLFSPAGTSYDRYQHFEERGRDFRRILDRLLENKRP